MAAKLPQAIIIFVLSCYFIAYGISITTWLIAGMLSWALIVHLMLAITQDMPENANSRLLYGTVCLALMIAGSLQIFGLAVSWFIDNHYLSTVIAITILLCVWILWWRGAMELCQRFKHIGTTKQLDIE